MKSAIDSSYSNLDLFGVLVKEKDSSCLDYLKEYIPLGAMLTREYFNTDAEYEVYVANYMNKDYC